MAMTVTSAGGLLAMLNETHPSLKLHALSNLNTFVDYFWPEISTSVPIMYSLLSPLSSLVNVFLCIVYLFVMFAFVIVCETVYDMFI